MGYWSKKNSRLDESGELRLKVTKTLRQENGRSLARESLRKKKTIGESKHKETPTSRKGSRRDWPGKLHIDWRQRRGETKPQGREGLVEGPSEGGTSW